MKLPRDLSGDDLINLLKRYGYQVVRQTGSHVRLTCLHGGSEHHLTIPNHHHLSIGLLNQVLADVATFLGKSKQGVMTELFG